MEKYCLPSLLLLLTVLVNAILAEVFLFKYPNVYLKNFVGCFTILVANFNLIALIRLAWRDR